MAATAPHNPPFRADHVGSLLRPPELNKAKQDHADGKISATERRQVQDAAIRRMVAREVWGEKRSRRFRRELSE